MCYSPVNPGPGVEGCKCMTVCVCHSKLAELFEIKTMAS